MNMSRLFIIVTLLLFAWRLTADERTSCAILNYTGDMPENLRLSKSSNEDKCVMAVDKEQSCIRLEQCGGPSGGYWQIAVKKEINIKAYRFLKIEIKSNPKAEMCLDLITTTGKGIEVFNVSFDTTWEWNTYYIPLTQNDEGRGGFKFTGSFDGSDNNVLRAGKLVYVRLAPWKSTKQVFYVRSIFLTSGNSPDQLDKKI